MLGFGGASRLFRLVRLVLLGVGVDALYWIDRSRYSFTMRPIFNAIRIRLIDAISGH